MNEPDFTCDSCGVEITETQARESYRCAPCNVANYGEEEEQIKMISIVEIDAYAVVRRAVEEGAHAGVNRAHKHTDSPTREEIAEKVLEYVMLNLTEVVKFGD